MGNIHQGMDGCRGREEDEECKEEQLHRDQRHSFVEDKTDQHHPLPERITLAACMGTGIEIRQPDQPDCTDDHKEEADSNTDEGKGIQNVQDMDPLLRYLAMARVAMKLIIA